MTKPDEKLSLIEEQLVIDKRAVRDGRSTVRQSDLEESVEVVIAGYQKKNAILSDKEKRVILPEQFLASVFGVDGPSHANQGNKERAEHLISKKKCQAVRVVPTRAICAQGEPQGKSGAPVVGRGPVERLAALRRARRSLKLSPGGSAWGARAGRGGP